MFVQNFKYGKIFVLEIWGKRWSKMGFFGKLSKSNEYIWFILLGKEDIIVLRVHAKFHDESISGSRDIWGKRGQKWVFSDFSRKIMNIFGSFS